MTNRYYRLAGAGTAAVLLLTGCAGGTDSPSDTPAAGTGAAQQEAEAGPATGMDLPTGDLPAAADPWAKQPVMSLEFTPEDEQGLWLYDAGENLLVIHYPLTTTAGEPTRLELLTPTGEQLWTLDTADIPDLPIGLHPQGATVVEQGGAITVAFDYDMQTQALLHVAADGAVERVESVPDGDVVALSPAGVVRVDQARRQLTVHDPATDELRSTTALGPAGTRVEVTLVGDRHARASLLDPAGEPLAAPLIDLTRGLVV